MNELATRPHFAKYAVRGKAVDVGERSLGGHGQTSRTRLRAAARGGDGCVREELAARTMNGEQFRAIRGLLLRVAVLWVTVPVAAKARGLPRARVNHRNVTVLSRMAGAPPQQEINEPTST